MTIKSSSLACCMLLVCTLVVTSFVESGTAKLQNEAAEMPDQISSLSRHSQHADLIRVTPPTERKDQGRKADLAFAHRPLTDPSSINWQLISYWKADSDALDSYGGNDGSLHAVSFVPGTSGSAFSLDGGYVSVPNSPSLQPQKIKVEAWIRHQGSPGANRYVLSQGADQCRFASYGLYTSGSGGLRFYVSNGTSFFESGDAGAGIWNGSWRHVIGIYDGTSVRLIVDDIDRGGITLNTSIAYNLPTDNKFYIGTYGGDSNACSGIPVNFRGDIDEVKVWGVNCDGPEFDLNNSVSQADPPWGGNVYDHKQNGETIQGFGCALSSLTMALKHASITKTPDGHILDPGTLNSYMKLPRGSSALSLATLFQGSSVDWVPTTYAVSNGALKFVVHITSSVQDLEEILCQGFPVIAGVKLKLKRDRRGNPVLDVAGNPVLVPGHFILITGKRADGKFSIADPGCRTCTTSDAYPNGFVLRGYVAPMNYQPPQASQASSGGLANKSRGMLIDAAPTDLSGLTVTGNGSTDLMVVDGAGRRTGYDPTTQKVYQEIPNAIYFNDALENDVTGELPTNESHFIYLQQPPQGSYQVVAFGVTSEEHEVTIDSYSSNGSSQPPVVWSDSLAAGTSLTHQIQFIPAPEPSLLTWNNSSRAIALDSVTFMTDPFPLEALYNLSQDRQPRISFFAVNVRPGSVITAQAEDAQNTLYPLTIEYVGNEIAFNWLTQVVVKLPKQIGATGDIKVSLTVDGRVTNKASVGITR